MLEILAVVGLLGFYLVADTFVGEDNFQRVNVAGAIALVVVLSYANWRMIRSDSKSVWTALFWFRLSTAIYFGVGMLLVYVVDDVTRLSMESFYAFTDKEILKLNILIALAVLSVLAMARWAINVTYRRAIRMHQRTAATERSVDRALRSTAVVSLALGIAISYGLVMPYRMGWSDFVLPGSVMSLKMLVPVGVFLLVLWGRRRAKWMLPMIFTLVAVEMLLSLLYFAKSDVLLLLIMVSMAFLWERVTIIRLVVIGVIVGGTYFAIGPIVDYGRHELGLRYGANTQAGFGERWEILHGYSTDTHTVHDANERQGGLARLSYVNAATFLVHLYDSGRPDDWPQLLGVVFVPRFLWPEKPITTAIGPRIYTLATGNEGSSSGAGLVAEAYWAGGWWGVVLFMAIYGAAIGVLTRFASVIMDGRQWLYFPVVLLAMRYGSRTDGHYIADAAGGLVILVAFYLFLRLFDKFAVPILRDRAAL